MDWTRAVNAYCERAGPGLWAEPLNAVSNLAFLVAAWAVWRLAAREGDRAGQALAILLAAIGLGSLLFHTVAQIWAMAADVLPIQIFILAYLALATMRFFAVPAWAGCLAAAAFVPASLTVAALVRATVGPLNGSADYVAVPLLIAAYAFALRRRAPATARGLLAGAGLLALSLLFRTVDRAACGAWPAGTHFLWHLVNAVMLWWMIRVLVRHPPPAHLA